MLEKSNIFLQNCNFHTKTNNLYIKTVEVTILNRQIKNDQINWTKALTLFKITYCWCN